MFPKNSANLLKFAISKCTHHLASMLLICQDLLGGFLITLLQNGPFASNNFFRPKSTAKVAIIKTKSAAIAFFSSPPFLLLALSFSPFLFLFYCDFGSSQA